MIARPEPIPGLVLGTGLTVLGTIRCLAAAGVPSYCLSEGLGFEASSRWCRRAGTALPDLASADALADALNTLPFPRGVLFACSDHWTVALDDLPGEVASRFPASRPGRGVVSRFIDKASFARLLSDAGVPHPPTTTIDDADALDRLLERAPAGVFLKPADSQGFLRTFGVKALRVDDPALARAHYRRAADAGVGLMLQEYIPGPPDRHYFIDGFVDAGHAVTTAFARRRLRMHPPDFGNSSYLVAEPLDAVGDALAALRRLFAHARYRGIFSAEFKRDERDGVLKLIEVNCRPWWYVEFAARCGVNVVDRAYRDALGMAAPADTGYRAGAGLVHTYYDYYACRRMRRSGALSLASWTRSWLTAKKAIFRADDPGPALSKLSSRVWGGLRRRAARRAP